MGDCSLLLSMDPKLSDCALLRSSAHQRPRKVSIVQKLSPHVVRIGWKGSS